MYPFGSLPENLAAFCDFLRRRHGFRIGPGELHDAARVLEIVDLADERAVRHALRPILSRTRDNIAVFDRAFTAFFFPRATGLAQPGLEPMHRELGPQAARRERRTEARPRGAADRAEEEEVAELAGATFLPEGPSEAGAEPVLVARASYSPLEAMGAPPELARAQAEWRDAARRFVRYLHLGLSRRLRSAARGQRFDLRRTLRASLQSGGEPLTARWLRRRKRAPRFVLLIDGSRSMGPSAQAALEMGVALAAATMRLEVFTFSTSLEKVTGEVRRAAAGTTRRLAHLRHAWAGGTHIGGSLRQFLRRYGERTIARDTVVIIVSDGLDVGEPEALRQAMHELRRRSAAVIWLNPLLATPGYEPTATGMRAARPYVTTLASANQPEEFARLSRRVRLRR